MQKLYMQHFLKHQPICVSTHQIDYDYDHDDENNDDDVFLLIIHPLLLNEYVRDYERKIVQSH